MIPRISDPPPEPPPLPGQPLEYGGSGRHDPAGYVRRPSFFSIIRFVGAMIFMAVVAVIFLGVIPRLETVYADFGTKLPAITVAVLNTSRFLRTPIGWVFGTLVAGVVAVTFAVLPVKGKWLRLIVILLLALLALGLALAVMMPILNLIESISGNPGKM